MCLFPFLIDQSSRLSTPLLTVNLFFFFCLNAYLFFILFLNISLLSRMSLWFYIAVTICISNKKRPTGIQKDISIHSTDRDTCIVTWYTEVLRSSAGHLDSHSPYGKNVENSYYPIPGQNRDHSHATYRDSEDTTPRVTSSTYLLVSGQGLHSKGLPVGLVAPGA